MCLLFHFIFSRLHNKYFENILTEEEDNFILTVNPDLEFTQRFKNSSNTISWCFYSQYL